MEKKIIKLTKANDGSKCILCCENTATIKLKINRLVCDDSITSFFVCDTCLSKMQKDIEVCK